MKTLRIVENRKYFFILPICVILTGLIFMIVNNATGRGVFNFDVEFSGGTSFLVDMGAKFNNDDVVSIVREITGQDAPQVQKAGTGETQVMIKVRSLDQETRTALRDAFIQRYGVSESDITYSDVSPTVSADMQRSATLAVVVACALMLVYISIRFKDVKMGTAAIIALLHDAFIIISFYSILRIPVNYSFIAVLLAMLGYSINATIIIFDRVRENKARQRKAGVVELVNTSVIQTLRRTINTSVTTLAAILFLYILGVPSIKEFSLPIIIVIFFSGYSSMFLVGSFWCMFHGKKAMGINVK